MSKKKIIILAAILLALVIGVTAFAMFGLSGESIAPAENAYGSGSFSYSTQEQSSDIVIDGVLDEEVWNGKLWWKNTYLSNVTGTMPRVELTAFPTQYGAYIGSVVYDTNLTSDGERAPGTNSNWELYISACDADQDLFSSELNGSWSVKRFYVDMYGGAFTYFNDFDRAVVVEGELNSGATTSATLEMFIPWETLGVDISKGIPESFGILPCYRAVLETGGSTSWMSPADSSLSGTTSAYLFDKTGYFNADRENAVVGDGIYGYAKTKGWDLTQIEDGIVRSSRGGTDKIFFTDTYGENFIVETTIIPVSAVNDAWPKAGITFLRTDGQHHTVWLDAQGADGLVDSVNGTKNFPAHQLVTLNQNNGWNQKTLTGYDKANPNAAKQEGVKLTVVKYGSQFWYFADGRFLMTEEVSFMDGDAMPGFWSLGMDAYYKDYSCEQISDERLTEYLNEKGLYVLNAKVEGAGGSVALDKKSLEKGGSYTLSLTSKSGYRVSSVKLNGQDILAQVSAQAVGGVYTVSNVAGNQDVTVTFEKCEEAVYSGSVTNGEKAVAGTMTVEGITDRSNYYVIDFTAKKDFTVKLPAGKYAVKILADGCVPYEKTLELTGDLQEVIEASPSAFADSVKVNGKNAQSDREQFDLSQEHHGKVYASYDMKSQGAALYFDGCGTDFVAQVTMNYTTKFDAYGSYQPDLIGGFVFSDGTNENVLWARDTGVIYTKWKYKMGLFNKSVLTYPNPKTAVFTVAKLGDELYIYLDGKQVCSAKWNELVPNIASDSEIAVGLNMWTDKQAQLEFSDYSVNFDSDYVSEYVKTH